MKDLVRSKLVPKIRKELAKLAPALIAEHGKDIQHAPGSNPSSGFATPKNQLPQSSTQTPRTSTPSTTTTRASSNVNTVTVTASDEFRTTAEELYTTFTDPQRIAAFTRAAPRRFDGANVGGKFAIFDGNVDGEYIKLESPILITQKWRLAQWPEGHYSTQEIKFDQNDVDRVTTMRVKWDGVPVGQEDVVKRNWEGYYVRSIKQTFGCVLTYFPPVLVTLLLNVVRLLHFPGPIRIFRPPTLCVFFTRPSFSRSIYQGSWSNLLTIVFSLLLLLAVGLARFSDLH